MYRLNVAKHDTESKQLETDGCNRNQRPQKKLTTSPLATSSPVASSTVQGDGSPQNNGNCVRRKLMFLSERQSEMSPIIGAPNPPPCTPDNTGLNNEIHTHLHKLYF